LPGQHTTAAHTIRSIVLIWTFGVTVARSVRAPNQFAEAHWLLDYRFGFMKRGLVGSLCSAGADLLGMRMTEHAILLLSGVVAVTLASAVLLLLVRILGRHAWRDGAVVTCLVLVSSPFTVMGAHLVGYFDSLLFLLALASVLLVLRGRWYAAAAVSVVALLTHESYALIGLPLVWLAAVESVTAGQPRTSWHAAIVLLGAPVLAFISIPVIQGFSTEPALLRAQLTQHLESFGFLGDRSQLVALWQTTPLTGFLEEQVRELDNRILDPAVFAVVAPTLLTGLLFIHSSFRIRPFGPTSGVLLAAVCAPLAMHAVAWDTARISTYTIGGATAVLWMLSEGRRPRSASRLVLLAAVPAMVLNAFGRVPLMDAEPDRFTTLTRLLIYLPAFAVTAAAAWRGGGLTPISGSRSEKASYVN
jgi:hypothetical protein